MYAVEAEHIDSAIAKYGPGMLLVIHQWNENRTHCIILATKMGAIVGGQVMYSCPKHENLPILHDDDSF